MMKHTSAWIVSAVLGAAGGAATLANAPPEKAELPIPNDNEVVVGCCDWIAVNPKYDCTAAPNAEGAFDVPAGSTKTKPPPLDDSAALDDDADDDCCDDIAANPENGWKAPPNAEAERVELDAAAIGCSGKSNPPTAALDDDDADGC